MIEIRIDRTVDVPISWNGSDKDVDHNYWAKEDSGEAQKKKRSKLEFTHLSQISQNFIVVESIFGLARNFNVFFLFQRIVHGWSNKLFRSRLNLYKKP